MSPCSACRQLRKVPTLVLVGESDPRMDFSPNCPRERDRLRVQTVPRGGHWLPEERPDPVAAALLTFFREQVSRPGSLPRACCLAFTRGELWPGSGDHSGPRILLPRLFCRPRAGSSLARWPWPQAVQDTPHPGVTHWLDTSSPDGTMLDFFDFDFGKNPHLRFEIYDQDEDDTHPFDDYTGRMGSAGP